jgi:hypothetical protein
MNNGNNNYMRRKTDDNLPTNYTENEEDYNMNTNNNEEDYDYHNNNNINNYNRRNTDNTNNRMNVNTLINVNSGQPIGLDLKGFMNNQDPDMTVHSISQTNDLPIISEVKFLFYF